VPLWIERYLIPICATIVFGLVILNPLKLDWQQRVALLIAISAFAYFLAHTVHKPKLSSAAPIVDAPDPRIGVLEQQVSVLKSQQERLLQEDQEQKGLDKKKTEIRDHLSKLITHGTEIRNRWKVLIEQFKAESEQQEYEGAVQKWHLEIVSYLKTIPRGDNYLARFQAGSRETDSYPPGIYQNHIGTWDILMSDLTKLNEFITDPDLGRP
jgi:hypothetical protein